ncbi:unnamed protein product, partial [Vitis vinifera]
MSETIPTTSDSSSLDSISKVQSTIQALSHIVTVVPPSLSSSPNPSLALLHDPQITSQISSLLRQPNSGAGDNNLCRWLYDTFQSSDPNLQLVVLRFIPIIAGVYLSRVLRKHLAGFEAVLLALYAHETTSRAGQAITVNVPDLSHSSIYHETKAPLKKDDTEQNLAVVSPSLEPHGTVRSSRRARIVGGISGTTESEKEREVNEGRIPLPWELLQPVLRILGHCLMGPTKNKELSEAASAACRSLYARSLHDIDPKAILATESLLRLGKLELQSNNDFDPTDIPKSHLITL